MRSILAGFSALLSVFSSVASAQTPEEFFKGKTITIVVGHEVGTGFDVYSRVLIRHMPRHIPGNPSMVVQNMLGASGVTAANWLYNIAPRDGTAMATYAQTVPLEPMFGNNQARYDPARYIWIGNMESSIAVCGVHRNSGVTQFSDLQKREIVMGATGPTGPLVKSALAVKNLLDAKIRVITGYKGSADVKLAMSRGEVQGICGLPWSTVKSFWRQELETGEFRAILQLSGDRSADIPPMPHYSEFIKSEETRQLFGILFGVQALGRTYSTPPDVPAERIEVLRAAFMKTMADPEFLADAQKTGIDIMPMDGASVQKLWAEYASTPAPLVEKAKVMVAP